MATVTSHCYLTAHTVKLLYLRLLCVDDLMFEVWSPLGLDPRFQLGITISIEVLKYCIDQFMNISHRACMVSQW